MRLAPVSTNTRRVRRCAAAPSGGGRTVTRSAQDRRAAAVPGESEPARGVRATVAAGWLLEGDVEFPLSRRGPVAASFAQTAGPGAVVAPGAVAGVRGVTVVADPLGGGQIRAESRWQHRRERGRIGCGSRVRTRCSCHRGCGMPARWRCIRPGCRRWCCVRRTVRAPALRCRCPSDRCATPSAHRRHV